MTDLTDDTDPSGVIAAIGAYCRAYNLGERPFAIAGVENFYSKDNGLVVAIPGAPDTMFQSWEQYAAAWSAALEHFSSFFFEANGDLTVRRIGGLAWASQTGRSHGTMIDSTAFSRNLRQTLVLMDEGDQWRIIQEHVSLGA